jgi:hypothetical protein
MNKSRMSKQISILTRKNVLSAVLMVVLAFLAAPQLMAQELAATITGTVADSSGAVIAGAKIVITQNGVNGASRTVTSDQAGNYTATNMSAGTYTVTVTAAGFSTFTGKNLVLNVAQHRSLDVVMKPGAVTTTMTVEESAVQVDTVSSEQADTISGTQVRELELNNRNFEQLVTLQPGVVSGLPDEVGFGLNNATTISVNGARSTANNWTVDGADINDSGSNGTLLNVPSIDAIQEFTLERSGYDAGYGHSGGGQILAVTKSGTSSFHGDVYEFDRNTLFNADTYFNKENSPITPRGSEHYNNYGFTLGGPLYIPRVYNTAKNKTMFFWSEEWRKVSAPTSISLLAPTPAMLNGTFTGPITFTSPAQQACVSYDATTNLSQISSSCYSQNAKVFLKYVYGPFPGNSNGLYNTSISSMNNFREDLLRIDHQFSSNLRLFARGMQDEVPQDFPQGLWTSNFPGLTDSLVNAPGHNVVVNLTWTPNQNLVNELEGVFAQGEIRSSFAANQIVDSPTVVSQLTNKLAYQDPYGRMPGVAFTGGIYNAFQISQDPYHERNLDRSILDNFTAVLGKHTLRAGFIVQFMLKSENGTEGSANFDFNTWQDFLVGNAASYTQVSRDITPDLHFANMETYIQDDWKLAQHLTINLGVRYSHFPSPADINNVINNFVPSIYSAAKAPQIDPATGYFVTGQAFMPNTYTNGLIFPAGSACTQAQAISSQITCSPWGSRVNPPANMNFAPRVGFAYDPLGNNKLAIRGGFGIFYDRTLNGIWEQNGFQDPPLVQTATASNTSFDNPLQGNVSGPVGPNHLITTGSPKFDAPSYTDYNLSVQAELRPNTVASIAYVGATGRHLLGEIDANQPTVATREANPTKNVNAIVPYLGYSWFAERNPAYNSNFNSLQATLTHHSSNGLTLNLSYTWSKNMTNLNGDPDVVIGTSEASSNSYDIKMDHGPASLNQPQTFMANYVYDLPFFKQAHGLTGHVLGGWEVSGITALVSGQSITVVQASDPFASYPGGIDIGSPNGDILPRPDRVGPNKLIKKPGEWFDTTSFTDAVGHFGSTGNGTLLGPGIDSWDIGIVKNTRIAGNYRFQFRGEFFNAFNHTNFSSIDTNTDTSGYGQVTTAHNPRNVQLGAKLYF